MIPLFVFIKATLGIVFGRKGCRTQKGQFGKKGVYLTIIPRGRVGYEMIDS